ncbi:MAG: hypothetical protein H6641_12390 [Caldilineaceae bacterium]|nr:hypothetical protein [Caldilineaceae bacterium]
MTNQKSMTKQDLLSNFALRLASDDQFMASVIRKYQQQERLNLSEFMNRFSISESQLSRLSLCKRPSSEAAEFRKQVKQIADYIGVEFYSLVSMIRQVDSLDALSQLPSLESTDQATSSTQIFPALAAARDHDELDTMHEPQDDIETDNDIE